MAFGGGVLTISRETPQVLVVVLVFSLDPPIDPIKLNLPSTSHFSMVVSIGLHGRSLLLACIYRPPGTCACNFLEEFMSFVGFLSSIYPEIYLFHGHILDLILSPSD